MRYEKMRVLQKGFGFVWRLEGLGGVLFYRKVGGFLLQRLDFGDFILNGFE